MSIKVIQWVWDCSESRNAERLVLLAIADNAADDGSHAYPSVAELCRKANLSERAVQAAVARLVAAGELHVNVGGGRGHTNYYTVIMKPCSQQTPQNLRGSGAAGAAQTPQNSTGNPADSAGNPAESAPGTVPEPSNEPSSTSFDATASPTAQTILRGFIDWLGSSHGIRLSKRVIGIYAKSIKELLAEGFHDRLIRLALVAMCERGMTDRPTLLHSFVVQVQQARPTSGAPSGAKRFPIPEEVREERAATARTAAQVADELRARDPGLSIGAALALAKEVLAQQAASPNPLSTSSPTGYIEAEIVPDSARPQEVTGS